MSTLALADARVNVLDLTRPELEAAVAALGWPAYRARQLWHWVYQRGASSFADMTSLGAGVRAALEERFRIDDGRVLDHRVSADGTQKWAVHYGRSKANVETVFIPEVDRGTACLSSQGVAPPTPRTHTRMGLLTECGGGGQWAAALAVCFATRGP
jgi:23S rRNA (adenine2503-C2)-methyltransferase